MCCSWADHFVKTLCLAVTLSTLRSGSAVQIWRGVQEPLDVAATVPEMVGGACSLVFCCWYYAKKHWLANNMLGIAFSIQGIEHLSLGAVSTGVILLSGLFVYDIFWVFCTPVMVRQLFCQANYIT